MNRLRSLCVLATVALIATNASADLVGWWNFDDDTANDSSGTGNNGSFLDGAVVSTDVPSVFTGGKSVELSGSSRVEIPHAPSLDITSDITIAAWIKPVGNVSWDGIIAKNPSDGSANNHAGNYELRLNNNNRYMEFLWQSGGVNDTGAAAADPDNPIAEGVWTHVAFTGSSGGDFQFYVDGTPTASGMLPEGFGVPNTNPLFIGNRADLTTVPFDGLIDDVRLYNNVLSPVEILCAAQNTEDCEFVEGDADRDLDVDIDDYLLMRANMFRDDPFGAPFLGDVTNDAFVDFADFYLWKENFPGGAGAAEAAIAALSLPEPTTLPLLGIALAALLSRVRRHAARG